MYFLLYLRTKCPDVPRIMPTRSVWRITKLFPSPVVTTLMGLAMERSLISIGGLVAGILWFVAIIVLAVIMEVLKWRANSKTSKSVDSCGLQDCLYSTIV